MIKTSLNKIFKFNFWVTNKIQSPKFRIIIMYTVFKYLFIFLFRRDHYYYFFYESVTLKIRTLARQVAEGNPTKQIRKKNKC